MKAIWYEQPGDAVEVLIYGDMKQSEPGAGEVRVKVHTSGINPSDSKFRSGWMGLKQPYPKTIPHNDGAGVIDKEFPPNVLESACGFMKLNEAQPLGRLQSM